MGTYDRRDAPDLSNEASPWTPVVRQIPKGASVVDLGCWDGKLLSLVRERGARRVVGVERDRPAAAKAASQGLDVVDADLDDATWTARLLGERFDVALLIDVVEHVRDPLATMRRIADDVLAPGGRLVLSVPNIAHASIRLSLLVGDFERTDRGILDRTHLHFFTRRTLHQLLRDAGLAVEAEHDVVLDVPMDLFRATLRRANIATSVELERAILEPVDARAYQFVVTARPVEPGSPIPPPPPATGGDAPRIADRVIRGQAAKIRRLEERLAVLESKGPFRLLRYMAVRVRQRRERNNEERDDPA